MYRNAIFTICFVAIMAVCLTGCNKDEIARLNAQHVDDSTTIADLATSLTDTRGSLAAERTKTYVLEANIDTLTGKLTAEQKENARLQKKLDKQQAVLDSVIADCAAKAKQADAKICELQENNGSLQEQLTLCQADTARLQWDNTDLYRRLHERTVWHEWRKVQDNRTIWQEIWGRGKVKPPEGTEP